MSKREDTLKMYKYFLEKMDYKYKVQPSDRDMLTTFLIEVHLKHSLKKVGRRFLFNYLSYQFTWYQNSRTPYNKYSFRNIFGKSSLERFLNDEKYRDLSFLDAQFVRENKIRFSEIFPEVGRLKLTSPDRKRFHNTPAGLTLCLDTTSLYDRGCIECMTCMFSQRCKRIKEKLYAR